eukprot:TRINITY_DN47677_c0_g1_i1.p1 TRINITY_DN47677_c0_g1~~TRINITY_DN47677_c0_g1_i1.p1  ORF type:complete len:373 (+),score=83.86 TRINITY_DN47677_c0_g1_i1:50-1168(+)
MPRRPAAGGPLAPREANTVTGQPRKGAGAAFRSASLTATMTTAHEPSTPQGRKHLTAPSRVSDNTPCRRSYPGLYTSPPPYDRGERLSFALPAPDLSRFRHRPAPKDIFQFAAEQPACSARRSPERRLAYYGAAPQDHLPHMLGDHAAAPSQQRSRSAPPVRSASPVSPSHRGQSLRSTICSAGGAVVSAAPAATVWDSRGRAQSGRGAQTFAVGAGQPPEVRRSAKSRGHSPQRGTAAALSSPPNYLVEPAARRDGPRRRIGHPAASSTLRGALGAGSATEKPVFANAMTQPTFARRRRDQQESSMAVVSAMRGQLGTAATQSRKQQSSAAAALDQRYNVTRPSTLPSAATDKKVKGRGATTANHTVTSLW